MKRVFATADLVRLSKALSSPLRLEVVRLVSTRNGINLNELAEQLDVTSSALTSHIRLLENAGVLRVESVSGRRGLQKRCYLDEDQFLLSIARDAGDPALYETEIPIGSYTDFIIHPTCGMATRHHIIGQWDNPSYFDDPERLNAGILWMGRGFVEYRIPNHMGAGQRLAELIVEQELSSEAPGYNDDWPSDIHFSVNGRDLGHWTCPGDFGARRGVYTPEWWVFGINQYGLLKRLTVNREGSFIDERRIGETTIDELGIVSGGEIRYRLGVPDGAAHIGGMTLFGRGFGDFNHGLLARMRYEAVP